jgi:hypothetical protein
VDIYNVDSGDGKGYDGGLHFCCFFVPSLFQKTDCSPRDLVEGLLMREAATLSTVASGSVVTERFGLGFLDVRFGIAPPAM